MKTIPPALQAHLNQPATTLAWLLRVQRRDGVVLGFTSHDRTLHVGGVAYKPHTGISPTDIEARAGLAVDNLEIASILRDDAITEADLARGLYDDARIDVFLCNWASPSDGVAHMKRGFFGPVSLRGGQWTAEIRGLHEALQTQIGRWYLPECSATFGDARCKVNAEALKQTSFVEEVNIDGDPLKFRAGDALASGLWFASSTVVLASSAGGGLSGNVGDFSLGLVRWIAGVNAGTSIEVAVHGEDGLIVLPLPPARAIQVGDVFEILPGCDKTLEMCRDHWNNALNFRGFPHIPGGNKLFQSPNAR
jgi:uncharacterized phage protein (TIGR02218 family)